MARSETSIERTQLIDFVPYLATGMCEVAQEETRNVMMVISNSQIKGAREQQKHESMAAHMLQVYVNYLIYSLPKRICT